MSSSSASTSSMSASESAPRSSAKRASRVIVVFVDLEDLGQALADQPEDLVGTERARSTWVSAGIGHRLPQLLDDVGAARTRPRRRAAFTIAGADDEPCEITHTPFTPSSTAPPVRSGS